MKKNLVFLLFSFFCAALAFDACTKDVPPSNPYDALDDGNVKAVDTLERNGISAIHRDIVFPKCAKPGCHDGHFEPDFRTVESTYSTLVYAVIKKNNGAKSFRYRVVPDSSAKSVFYERLNNCCFVNTNDRMPQDNIGQALPDDDLLRIKTWIDEGAKDIFKVRPAAPNGYPAFPWWGAFDSKFPAQWNSISADSNRIDKKGDQPVLIAVNATFTLIPWLSDDKTSVGALTNSRLLLSYVKDDFSAPVKTIVPVKQIFDNKAFWLCTVSTAGLLTDTVVYMRYYCNDGDHAQDAEFPNNAAPSWAKSYWSLYIKP